MLVLLIAAALAQDAVSLRAVRHAQEGLSSPSLTFVGGAPGRLEASVRCDGIPFELSGQLSVGAELTLPLVGLRGGAHRCTGELSFTGDDGSSGEMPLSLEVTVHPPLRLAVAREQLDLRARTLVVRADRPLASVAIEVVGEGGRVLGGGETAAHGMDTVDVGWTAEPGEALRLKLTAIDTNGLPGELVLLPWSYAIPHDDVVFASGSAAIDASEVPKLEKAWMELQAVLTRYGDVVTVRLFVAGYTDTVGGAAYNQGLSGERARAIAEWFRDRGFHGRIDWQGFGESALAVSTPDETDEARNRRAVYLLAAEEPPRSGELPRSDWRAIP